MIRRRLAFALTLLVLSMAAARAQAGSTEVNILCIHDKPYRVSVATAPDPHLMLGFCGGNGAAKEMSYRKADVRLRPSKDPTATRLSAGEYAYVDPWVRGIATQSPLSKKKQKAIDAELMVFSSEWLNTAEIVLVMQRDGLAPATLDDLITLGANRPELQEKYHIVALGTAAFDPANPTVATFPVLGASVSFREPNKPV